ncbi:hypothetical protein ALI22I_23915 [Saccharothrix sp. ALI-22-I]|nr:hypothetical protein ALI22I_23915 [Saccharothrix sp. ALI-22-I]
MPEPVGSGGSCGCTPRSVRLRTNGVVWVLVVVILVVLQNVGVDPFAALGIVGAAGWVTTGLVPSLLGAPERRAALG